MEYISKLYNLKSVLYVKDPLELKVVDASDDPFIKSLSIYNPYLTPTPIEIPNSSQCNT